MTTVKQLIEYLQTLHEETEVEILKYIEGSYNGGYVTWQPLDLSTVYCSNGFTYKGITVAPYLQLGEE